MILGVAGGVALRRNSVPMAHILVGGRDADGLLQDLRRFDEGGREAGFDVPLDVAVEQPDACMFDQFGLESSNGICRVLIWIVGLEAQHEVAVCKDGDSVAAHGDCREIGRVAVVGASVWGRSCDNLDMMTVEVERVGVGVDIVDHDLDDFVVLQDEGVGVDSVDGGILSVAADTQRCIERWYLLL